MRLIVRCGLLRNTGKELSIIHAAAEEETTGARWFGTSFDLKTALTAVGVAVTLIVQHTNTQSTITRLQAELDADKAAAVQVQRQTSQRIAKLEGDVMGRHEIEGADAHLADRITLQQTEIQQLLALQLSRGGR